MIVVCSIKVVQGKTILVANVLATATKIVLNFLGYTSKAFATFTRTFYLILTLARSLLQ